MAAEEPFPSAERSTQIVAHLSGRLDRVSYDDLPHALRERLLLTLVDLFGVSVAGMRTPEMEALRASWPQPAGAARLPGTGESTTPETGAYLSAVAAACLELDEGNKFAVGHPAAHVVFAAVAAAQCAGRRVDGPEFLAAAACGYEVAARFGRALRRKPDWHTHGHWGITGAAYAAARLLGGSSAQTAAAIDASSGLMHVTPWTTVLAGDFTRNLWMAGSNVGGLGAARLAMAGLVTNRGSVQHSLGMLGDFEPTTLTSDLCETWLCGNGYLKQHAACSYTHAAVDLVQSLRTQRAWRVEEIRRVRVGIHSLAGPLLRRHPKNRLAAMFSLPFVVSTAVVNGRVDPQTMQFGSPEFVAAEEFSDRIDVQIREDLDAFLPHRRCTEVSIEFTDGDVVALAQPNPIGDTDHFPLSVRDVEHKLVALIGAEETERIQGVIRDLPHADDATRTLAGLP